MHRALTRANFPWATFGLILANVFVFFGLQLGDDGVRDRALAYYVDADLAQWEFPAYREWLDVHGDAEERAQVFTRFADAGDVAIAVQVLQSDADFIAALEADEVITPALAGHAQWRELRQQFDRLWEGGFTERWMLRYSEFSPPRILGSMFLHGGIGHLLGNMLFLALLGLLVEGALGHGLFLVVYLAGGFGAALASLAWHWGDHGSLVGASGAIAALMGAYCVLWGRRRVRFFWWFFIVFDYVRAPALLLLPVWLGWEVLQLLFSHGSNVAFDAHAGGIVSGALLAFVVRLGGRERRDFLDEDALAEAVVDDRAALAKANEHIGRLELPAARVARTARVASPGRSRRARRVLSVRALRTGCAAARSHRGRGVRLSGTRNGRASRAEGGLRRCDEGKRRPPRAGAGATGCARRALAGDRRRRCGGGCAGRTRSEVSGRAGAAIRAARACARPAHARRRDVRQRRARVHHRDLARVRRSGQGAHAARRCRMIAAPWHSR